MVTKYHLSLDNPVIGVQFAYEIKILHFTVYTRGCAVMGIVGMLQYPHGGNTAGMEQLLYISFFKTSVLEFNNLRISI